jgi:hypothetical protein
MFLIPIVAATWTEGPCTYHPYQEDLKRFGEPYDNNPGWCGTRYTMLNVARITAIHGITADTCNQCLEVQNARSPGQSIYVLVTDRKEAPGLDMALDSFRLVAPGSNPLDPQLCRWKFVGANKCGQICFGTKEECTPGVRNSLPAYLLPKMPKAPIGLDIVRIQETEIGYPTHEFPESELATKTAPVESRDYPTSKPRSEFVSGAISTSWAYGFLTLFL